MNTCRLGLAGLLFVSSWAAGHGDGKRESYQRLIVGLWEVTKGSEKTIPVGTIVEFNKEGIVKLRGKKDGKDVTLEGTYGVTSEYLLLKMKGDREPLGLGIQRLTDTELIITDGDSAPFGEFKRKK